MIFAGDRYTMTFSFTQEDVNQFAKVTGDTNPLHIDPEFAAQTPFKRPIMHGMLSASIFSKVLGTEFPGQGTIYMHQSLSFLRPMYVDTQYRAEFHVSEVNDAKHTATITTEVFDQETGKATVKGEAKVMNPDRLGTATS